MAIFTFKGIDAKGKEIRSNVNADSIIQAKQKIHSQGILLIDLTEESGQKKGAYQITFFDGVSINDLSLMTRQFATLIKAKIPLAEAILALVDQMEKPKLKIVLSEVRQKINEGTSLANSLREYPDIFDQVYTNMVEAGEASGNLDVVLLRLAEFTEAQSKLRNKISSSMMYPVIMMVVGSVMMIFIFTVIIPKMTRLFTSMKKAIPLPTKICIAISNFLQNYWITLVVLIPMLVYLFRMYIKTEKGKSRWHRFILNFPKLGKIAVMINVARFCSTLATLLNSGVPMLMALKIVRNLVSNVHMQIPIDLAKEAVGEGVSMTGPLIQSGYYPPMVTHMIRLGEKTGELEEMLQIVADNYEDQVNNQLDGLASIIEPIMMVILGLLVGFVVVSIVMPIMELNSIKR